MIRKISAETERERERERGERKRERDTLDMNLQDCDLCKRTDTLHMYHVYTGSNRACF